jgi:hypothetical protein
MTSSDQPASYDPSSNPFATRFTRPGALPYCFPSGESAAAIVAQLQAHRWRGEVVGPHGSGKTSLLLTLIGPIEATGRRVEWFALHDGQRALPAEFFRLPRDRLPRLIVIDGYEQLSRASRWRLRARCRRRGWGLLVTAHQSVGFPLLAETRPDVETALQIVRRLLPDDRAGITSDDVRRAFESHHGNVRETLFALYDLVESRRSRHANLPSD